MEDTGAVTYNIDVRCFAICHNPKCLSDPGDKRKTEENVSPLWKETGGLVT